MPTTCPHRSDKILEHYNRVNKIDLLTLRQFLERLYKAAYEGRCLLVGFNLPFDLSRVAYDFKNARGVCVPGYTQLPTSPCLKSALVRFADYTSKWIHIAPQRAHWPVS